MPDINIKNSTTYSKFMPKFNWVISSKKTKEQELKEIIQAPNDPLSKFPLRFLGYSNEVGAAVSSMPGWGSTVETALWVPALMYFGADIYDKYKRGRDGNYSKESATKAVEETIFQGLASVILPTAAVKLGQSIAGLLTKLDGEGLSASVKEELLAKLERDFSVGKFAKADRYDLKGDFKTGKQLALERIIDNTFADELHSARVKRNKESVLRKILNFFGHPKGLYASAKSEDELIKKYLNRKAKDIFAKQSLLENETVEEIEKQTGKGFIKEYQKAVKSAEKRYKALIQNRPFFVVEKILCSQDKRYDEIKKLIDIDFPTISDKKDLVSRFDGKGKVLAGPFLDKLMKSPKHKELIEEIAKKTEISNEVIGSYIRNKKLRMGLLKTVGGFIALGFLAVPIDNFVHKYIIKKFLEPNLENIKNIQTKLSFKNRIDIKKK